MMKKVLESIYEPIFLDCSYGFRPGRGCHDALKALRGHLDRNEVEVVIDIDLANFFGTIDHKLLEQILREKIADEKFIRYIIRMFKSGVLAKGELTISDEGVPQGSVCSPILANIFAHHVIDEWFHDTVKKHCRGTAEMFRYADDMVVCCRYSEDAKRIRKALAKRLTRFNLKLNEEKTHDVRFSKREFSKGIKQGTFDFLGFTFYLDKTRTGGRIVPKLRTAGKRFRSKLKNVNKWCRRVRNKDPLKVLWNVFRSKLRGHCQYYGMSFNSKSVGKFIHEATRIMFKWLNRRSQRKSFTWEKFSLYIKLHPLPNAVIYHRLF
jgi:group II intron reverse transcriptase/maturase